LAHIEHKARIEAKYAPYTQPNDMNREDAKEYLEDVALIDLFFEKGKTDEQIRLANIKAAVGRSPDDVLKFSALATMGGAEMGELGRALLDLPFTQAGLRAGELALGEERLGQEQREFRNLAEWRDAQTDQFWAQFGLDKAELDVRREELGFRREQDRLKRQGEELGEAREDSEYLLDLMLRATATHKATYGTLTKADKIAAAETLQNLIAMDASILPDLKMKWLSAVPHIMGVSLTRALTTGDIPRDYLDYFEKSWNQAVEETEALTGLYGPAPTYQGISLDQIMDRVEFMAGRDESKRKKDKRIAKYVKRFGFASTDEFYDVANEWLDRTK